MGTDQAELGLREESQVPFPALPLGTEERGPGPVGSPGQHGEVEPALWYQIAPRSGRPGTQGWPLCSSGVGELSPCALGQTVPCCDVRRDVRTQDAVPKEAAKAR